MTTAKEAHDRADAAHIKIDTHEELCALRYETITTGISDLKKYVSWLSALLLTLLLATLAWSLQQKSAAMDQRDDALLKELREMRKQGI